jgi:hypothetical protein
MVGVLSVEQSGLASGVNNTFRQLGIAASGAIFDHHIRTADAPADGPIAGNAIFLVAAMVVVVASAAAWPLLGRLRSST